MERVRRSSGVKSNAVARMPETVTEESGGYGQHRRWDTEVTERLELKLKDLRAWEVGSGKWELGTGNWARNGRCHSRANLVLYTFFNSVFCPNLRLMGWAGLVPNVIAGKTIFIVSKNMHKPNHETIKIKSFFLRDCTTCQFKTRNRVKDHQPLVA